MTLYEINAEILAILDAAMDGDGDVAPDTAKKLGDLQLAFDQKVEALLGYIKNTEAEAKAYMDEAEAFRSLADNRYSSAEWCRGYLDGEMKKAGRDHAGGKKLHVKLQDSPAKIEITEPELARGEARDMARQMVEEVLTPNGPKAWFAVKGKWRMTLEFLPGRIEGDNLPEYCERTRGKHIVIKHGKGS